MLNLYEVVRREFLIGVKTERFFASAKYTMNNGTYWSGSHVILFTRKTDQVQ